MLWIAFLVSLESSRGGGGGVDWLCFMAFELAVQKFLKVLERAISRIRNNFDFVR
jgi:hypothetical protein